MLTERQKRARQWAASEELAKKWRLDVNRLFNWANNNDINLDKQLPKWTTDNLWVIHYFTDNKSCEEEKGE